MTVAQIRRINDHGNVYEAITIWCPACQYGETEPGQQRGSLHMLPVTRVGNGDGAKRATWGWNGDLVRVTLTPSILTRYNYAKGEQRCHSFLIDGIWNFLGDCTHDMANKQVPMVELPAWAVKS